MTPQVVLTTLKCFIKVKAVREYYGLPQKYENDVPVDDLDPAEILVAQVTSVSKKL